MPPVEAMACGCPVISSTRGALGEVVGDAAALIDPEDVPSMTGQLLNLATDEAARTRFRATGLGQAQKFNWQITARETLKIYEHALQAA